MGLRSRNSKLSLLLVFISIIFFGVFVISCEVSPEQAAQIKGAHFDHQGITQNCATCHLANQPLPNTAVPTGATANTYKHQAQYGSTQDCSTCHNNTNNIGVTWSGAKFPHSPTPTSCLDCHANQLPTTTVPDTVDGFNHLPTYGSDCVQCHTAQPQNMGVTFSGAHWLHQDTQGNTVGTCQPCHDTRHHNQGAECRMCHIWADPGNNWNVL